MSRKGFTRNHGGYTLVEVMIASVLIFVLALGAMTGYRRISQMNQQAATRTSHTEMRARIFEALADSNNCAFNLSNPILPDPLAPDPKALVAISKISQVLFSGAQIPVVEDKQEVDGLRYSLGLRFPHSGYNERFPAGEGRINPNVRHQAQLEVTGERYILAEGGMKMPITALIPLSAEFDESTGVMTSCTLNPEETDEMLGDGSTHTVRQCIAVGGAPYPTDRGLICRVPVTTVNEEGYKGAIPSCESLLPGKGWQNVVGASGVHYNTTLARDASIPKCKSGMRKAVTGWHYLAPLEVEFVDMKVKKGSGKSFKWMLAGGAAFVIGGIAAIATLIGLFLIFLVFSKCKSETVTLYAQVNGVGCK